jgi:hypothetical protein
MHVAKIQMNTGNRLRRTLGKVKQKKSHPEDGFNDVVK